MLTFTTSETATRRRDQDDLSEQADEAMFAGLGAAPPPAAVVEVRVLRGPMARVPSERRAVSDATHLEHMECAFEAFVQEFDQSRAVRDVELEAPPGSVFGLPGAKAASTPTARPGVTRR